MNFVFSRYPWKTHGEMSPKRKNPYGSSYGSTDNVYGAHNAYTAGYSGIGAYDRKHSLNALLSKRGIPLELGHLVPSVPGGALSWKSQQMDMLKNEYRKVSKLAQQAAAKTQLNEMVRSSIIKQAAE
jgi:hypothetical protein